MLLLGKSSPSLQFELLVSENADADFNNVNKVNLLNSYKNNFIH